MQIKPLAMYRSNFDESHPHVSMVKELGRHVERETSFLTDVERPLSPCSRILSDRNDDHERKKEPNLSLLIK